MSLFHGVAGKRSGNPVGICFHNDAGSQDADTGFYEGWLPNHDPAVGFAHAYVASDGVLQAEDLDFKAWHCGDSYGNANYLSIEICQSMGDKEIFLDNEQRALDLAAEWFKLYGWTPNRTTVAIHKQFSATACPHRSCEIHGDGLDCVDYFISQLNERLFDSEKEPEETEEILVWCFYKVDGKDTVYWFNGSEIRALTNRDQRTILERIYKDCTGKDIPEYAFSSASPWHKRLIQACTLPVLTAEDGKIGG